MTDQGGSGACPAGLGCLRIFQGTGCPACGGSGAGASVERYHGIQLGSGGPLTQFECSNWVALEAAQAETKTLKEAGSLIVKVNQERFGALTQAVEEVQRLTRELEATRGVVEAAHDIRASWDLPEEHPLTRALHALDAAQTAE